MAKVGVGILAAGMNVAGNLILIPQMGIAGASLASSISYTALSGMIAWYYVKQSHVPWSELLPGRRDLRGYAAFVHQRLRARTAAGAKSCSTCCRRAKSFRPVTMPFMR